MAHTLMNPTNNTSSLRETFDAEFGLDPTDETKIADWVSEPVGAQKMGSNLYLRKLSAVAAQSLTPTCPLLLARPSRLLRAVHATQECPITERSPPRASDAARLPHTSPPIHLSLPHHGRLRRRPDAPSPPCQYIQPSQSTPVLLHARLAPPSPV